MNDAQGKPTRRCTVCKEVKEGSEFYEGQGNTCKKCNNERTRANRRANPIRYRATRSKWEKENKNRAISRRKARLRRRYQITLKQVDKLLAEQDGICPICKTPLISPSIHPDDEPKNATKAVVDHSHRDGHVRGILCSACNTGLGQFDDDLELIKEAYKYLKRDETKTV